MGRTADFLLHLILPNRCMFCRTPVEYSRRLCSSCERDAPFTEPSSCLVCGRKECVCKEEENFFSVAAAPFFYEMGADTAIQDLKFRGNFLNARKLAWYMARELQQRNLSGRFDVIVPVPLYPRDERKRGFNQSRRLAEWVARYTSSPLLCDLLFKVSPTKKQHELTSQERRKNLEGAFRTAGRERIIGKRILLIDDVFTTGSTLRECAFVLRKSGAGEVLCLTAARTRAVAK